VSRARPLLPSLALVVSGFVSVFVSGCSTLSTDPGVGAPPSTMENDPAFHARLLEIASSYEGLARVDDELHWAPFLCRQPMPSQPRHSASTDLDTHGRKLYYVFAKDRAGYLQREGRPPAPVGQVVVKEAWTVEEVPADTQYDRTQSPVRYLKQDGRLYHARQKAGLFVMFRLDPATPGTDLGWVYGTISPDGDARGKQVTSAGRVQACMGCHTQAPHERLFGIQYNGA
jgi:hypothetical protein